MENRALKLVLWHIVAAAVAIIIALASLQPARAAIIFQNDDMGDFASDGIVLDVDDQATTHIMIQFGSAIAETLKWSIINSRFELSNTLDLTNHQLTTARMENVGALPGGAPGLGAEGLGRFVYLTAIDSTAPGCTTSDCNPGSYIWNGTEWEKMSPTVSQSGASKIVTVGTSGRDYTTIADAATYLNSGSGGEIWLDSGTHAVTTSVNLTDIKVRGTDSTQSTVIITGSGKISVKETKFKDVTINVDSGITADMGLDAVYSATSNNTVEFEQVDFIVGSGKFLLGSTAATAPLVVVQFENCTATSGAGNLVKTKSASNLNASSTFTVIDKTGANPLKLQDWNVNIIGGGNVSTSGTITTTPDRIIEVSPGMNIQGAINSLGASGGTIKLLVGTHTLTTSIVINNNNITLAGEGPATTLDAPSATWVGGVTNNDALIQVGSFDGTSPRSNVVVRNLQLNVEPNIHGIQVNGGSEIKIIDNFIESTGAKSNARVGLLFTDSASSVGSRLTSARNYINSSGAGTRWVDGVHFDGNGDFVGQLFGYGNGIRDSIISETVVTQAQETSFAFSQVSASSVFSNRARDLAINAGAFGMFFNDCTDIMVINNTMEGASASATGISLYDNVDNSVFLGNAVRGGPTNFTVGIDIAGTTSSGNVITSNEFANVNTRINDAGTDTKMETLHHRATANPTASDDISKGYGIGTIWINTSTQNAWISVAHNAGAAVWKQIDSTGGSSGLTVSATPPVACTSGEAGRQFMDTDTGIVYVCDNTRNKWLSMQDSVMYGESSGSCSSGADIGSDLDCSVNWGSGLGPDSNTDMGFYVPNDITITGLGFSQDNNACVTGSMDIEVWGTGTTSNDNNYSLVSTVLSGFSNENYGSNTVSANINGGQYIVWGIDNNCGQTIDDFNVVLYFRNYHPNP